MANELRKRALAVGGLVEDAPLAAATTTLTSAGLAALPAVGTTEHMALVLDPNGAAEVAYVIAHTAGSNTATIARGQEGTVAVTHRQDTLWFHAQTLKDIVTPIARQGGSATDWTVGGTTTQALPNKMAEQVGMTGVISTSAGSLASLQVTFPTPFLQPPVVFSQICDLTTAAKQILYMSTPVTTNFVVVVNNFDNSGGTCRVMWRAIGEVA